MGFTRYCLLLAFLTIGYAASARDAAPWVEGRNYFRIIPAQPTAVPRGKVEVTEVFSYACVVCNRFLPSMQRLAASLPSGVVIDYLPASFNPAEDWPVFQRAYLTAQLLGVADRAHAALFDAIWKTGELAIVDPATNRIKARPPTIEDVARFYHRTTGVAVSEFISAANSMGVETRMNQADALIMGRYGVTGTPTIIVNGKYRADIPSAGDADRLVDLVRWLAAREGAH
jgi:thiol:disulfide interchange protein DsbA